MKYANIISMPIRSDMFQLLNHDISQSSILQIEKILWVIYHWFWKWYVL